MSASRPPHCPALPPTALSKARMLSPHSGPAPDAGLAIIGRASLRRSTAPLAVPSRPRRRVSDTFVPLRPRVVALLRAPAPWGTVAVPPSPGCATVLSITGRSEMVAMSLSSRSAGSGRSRGRTHSHRQSGHGRDHQLTSCKPAAHQYLILAAGRHSRRAPGTRQRTYPGSATPPIPVSTRSRASSPAQHRRRGVGNEGDQRDGRPQRAPAR